MSLKDRITGIVLPIAQSNGSYIIDVDVRGERGGKVVEIFVDTDEGVSAGLCERISKDVSRALDISGCIVGRYDLVVSSPGIDRPLKFPRQYPKNVGRAMRVKIRNSGGAEKLDGILVEVTGHHIVLRSVDEGMHTIAFDDIVEAHVQPKW